MKKGYLAPEVEVIAFEKTDVMLASGNPGQQSDFYGEAEGGNE